MKINNSCLYFNIIITYYIQVVHIILTGFKNICKYVYMNMNVENLKLYFPRYALIYNVYIRNIMTHRTNQNTRTISRYINTND